MDTPVAFVDSSTLVALADSDDPSHSAVVDAYRSLAAENYRLFTTDHVLAEAYDLITIGLGSAIARQWLRDLKLAIYTTTDDDLARAREKMLAAPLDSPMTMTSALSIVVMERLGVSDAFAVDQAFLAALG